MFSRGLSSPEDAGEGSYEHHDLGPEWDSCDSRDVANRFLLTVRSTYFSLLQLRSHWRSLENEVSSKSSTMCSSLVHE